MNQSPNPNKRPPIDGAGDGHLLAEVQRGLGDLARELGSPEATLDMMFLAYLLKASKFGYFTFGPITIDVRVIDDLVSRTASRSTRGDVGLKASYSDDCLRFIRVLSEEVEASGRRRIDELHFLLAFMKINEGIPGRVFAEIGISPEQVRAFVPEGTGPDRRLFSPEEAAEYLGVHVKTVRNWIRSGRLRASRLAGQRVLRIRGGDIERLLEPVEPDGLED